MNVVIVNDFGYADGGASHVALTSAIEVSKMAIPVTFFCAVPPISQELRESGVRVVCIGQADIASNTNKLHAGIQGLWNVKAASSIRRELIALDPKSTIIHIHGWTKSLSSSVAKQALNMGFKVVMTLHDYFTSCPNGGFFNYRLLAACNLPPLSISCMMTNCDSRTYAHKAYRIVRQTVQNWFGKVPSGLHGFFYCSNFSLSHLEPALPKATPRFLLRNPMDFPCLPPVRPSINKEYCYIGRLSPEKGVLLLAEAARRVGVPLVFIGDGPLRDQILKIYPQATITGWLDRQQVRERLRLCRALILPSLVFETQGMTVVEAQSQGIPPLAPSACASSEFITNGVTGLLFKSGSVEDLSDKILALSNNSLVDKIGEASYAEYWKFPHTTKEYVKSLLDSYNSVLGS